MIKRCQIGTAFIYMFSAVIVVFILVFGYRSIIGTQESIEQTELAMLKNKIISDIETIRTDFGSSKTVFYSIPSQTQLCIFDLSRKDEILINLPPDFNPLIIDSIRSNIQKNAFVFGGGIFELLYLGEIEINEPYFHCLKSAAGKVSFVVEGLGNRTLVKFIYGS